MDKPVYTLGIDIGSAASKCLLLENGAKIVASSLEAAGAGTGGPVRAVEGVLRTAGLSPDDIAFTVATGYGRGGAQADARISELTCHARGAHHLCPEARTVIDIGGQDAKVLRLSPEGALQNFVMNDKCAAGTGRFIEVMARVMETEPRSFTQLAQRSSRRVDISSTCAVFAESEVISQLAAGVDRCDIIAGIQRSVAARTAGLARRAGISPTVAMTGGVARGRGIVRELERELGTPIATFPLAQHAGALGAALIAHDKLMRGAAAGSYGPNPGG